VPLVTVSINSTTRRRVLHYDAPMGGVLLRCWLGLALSVVAGACTEPDPNFCAADEECEGEKSRADESRLRRALDPTLCE
jgi:hypothetical protein